MAVNLPESEDEVLMTREVYVTIYIPDNPVRVNNKISNNMQIYNIRTGYC